MDEKQKKEILLKFTEFFRGTLAKNHIKNLIKLKKLSEFNPNPFLIKYLANFLTGNSDSESLAKILIYPRILGTSITTSFGQNLQNAAPSIFRSVLGSGTAGIDLEFTDYLDGRKKYSQIKSGPNTLNFEDITTIQNHFTDLRNRARVNRLPIEQNDLIIGVLYGEPKDLSSMYKTLEKNYPVYVGKDFWHRLTGDENFYAELIQAFGDVAKETSAKELLEEVIKDLAKDIQVNFIDKELK